MAAMANIMDDTKYRLQGEIQAMGSARAWALKHGISPAIVSHISNGHHRDVSTEAENQVRDALGLAPRPALDLVARCPHCPDQPPHTIADCCGVEGTPAIVPEGATIAPPGSRVVMAGPKKKRNPAAWRVAIDDSALAIDVREWWFSHTPYERALILEHAWEELT